MSEQAENCPMGAFATPEDVDSANNIHPFHPQALQRGTNNIPLYTDTQRLGEIQPCGHKLHKQNFSLY